MVPIRQVLRAYAPQDIFNCDESGLFWRMIPGQSLYTCQIPGRKKESSRINALFCCNSDASERLPIWFVGTAERPKAFTAASINIENLGCVWRSHRYAWITGDIFKEWLIWFDQMMVGRKVALLLDNFSAHETGFKETRLQLQNTLIVWLPTNQYQPLEQGIIRTWKAYWKREWMSFIMAEFERGYDPVLTMTVLKAIQWAISAWNLDVPADTIISCFRKALAAGDTTAINIDNSQLVREIQQEVQRLQLTNRINEAMNINQFLDSAEEQVTDNLEDIDRMVLCQFTTPEEEEDDGWEALPTISASDALESLQKLRLYEEQQADADRAFIQLLLRHERVLIKRKGKLNSNKKISELSSAERVLLSSINEQSPGRDGPIAYN
ncbi:hypothetical protein EYZ11_010853 [Aspergillus tanneri]|uniref:DDE-1 domain-containing protein n=1 Tax=Aspergillus tanneri TaxID=1220188 RepID=A0A4S3J4W4_9EURO|nr:hypothetical protein EYZ11_010853 [Aspergillus tanneri]